MKTIIEYTTGEQTEWDDAYPSVMVQSCDGDAGTVTMCDAQDACVSDNIALQEVKRVVFEP